jgi:hypothetical protein
MIDHCYVVSGEINLLFFLSSQLSLFLCFFFFTFMYLFLENKNQIKHILN